MLNGFHSSAAVPQENWFPLSHDPDDPGQQLQRLVDGLLELNCVLQLAHDRLEELRDLGRQSGYHPQCVELVVQLDALRHAVNSLRDAIADAED